MSNEEYRLRYQAAQTYRKDGSNEEAGTTFSLAAYELLGGSELGNRDELLTAVTTLTEAAICYRIGGHDERCRIRCRQGETVVDELDALLYEKAPFEALANELRGIFDSSVVGTAIGNTTDGPEPSTPSTRTTPTTGREPTSSNCR